MLKKKYIFGNWKLNKNLTDTTKFFSQFYKQLSVVKTIAKNNNLIYGFAPVSTCLSLSTKLKRGKTAIIAQDVSEYAFGSYTGQVSCLQLKDFNIKYAIVGHSETRKYLGCTDLNVNAKSKTCLINKITPIICIGESLAEYNKKQTKQVLAKQLKIILKGIDARKCIIAYEPLWAIGSGKTPTLKEINSVCEFIRKTIKQLSNVNVANNTPILYGGSVNEVNALKIVTLTHVNGLLIGGASLIPNKFVKILKDINTWQKEK